MSPVLASMSKGRASRRGGQDITYFLLLSLKIVRGDTHRRTRRKRRVQLAQCFLSKLKSLSQRFVRGVFGGALSAALPVPLLLLLLLPHPQDLELVPRDQPRIDDVQVLRRSQVNVREFRQAAPQLRAEHFEALRTAASRGLGKLKRGTDKDTSRLNCTYATHSVLDIWSTSSRSLRDQKN